MREISEKPLDLTVKCSTVTAIKKSPEEVPAQKQKDQPKEKESEAVVQESGSEKADSDIEENSEDVMGQLLPYEDMTIRSPFKER